MGRYDGKTCKMLVVMSLVVTYFLIELIVGHFIQSLALIADAFHMLSDFIALIVGIISQRLTKMPRTSRNTFGWQRADVVGSLINTVILCTLCFTIFIRAIERFIEDHMVHKPLLMVAVGAGGLVLNLISLAVLGHHGHSHGHVHMESEEDIPVDDDCNNITTSPQPPVNSPTTPPLTTTPTTTNTASPPAYTPLSTNDHTPTIQNPPPYDDSSSVPIDNQGPTGATIVITGTRIGFDEKPSIDPPLVITTTNGTNVDAHPRSHAVGFRKNKLSNNLRAVFLHVIADALGSVIVVISSLIIYFAPEKAKWKRYIDPAMSMVLVIIIVGTTAKLLYRNALILLQSVPDSVKYGQLKEDLENVSGQNKLHDLHVWRLQNECIIGTVHIRFRNIDEYLSSCKNIKSVFHKSGVHCTTIQPEFDEQDNLSLGANRCILECGNSQNECDPTSCCPTNNPSPDLNDRPLTTANSNNNVEA